MIRRMGSCFFNSVREEKFIYYGRLEGKTCSFKIDTGSDVSIVYCKFVKKESKKLKKKSYVFKYPTGETVPVNYRVFVKIELGKFSLKVPMFVADIKDDCLLGTDFLKIVNL